MRLRLVFTALASLLALAVAAAPADASTAKLRFERSAAAPSVHLQVAQQALTIQVGNATSVTFDELALFFNRFGQPAELVSRLNFAPGDVEVFTLAGCQDIEAYALGLFDDGQLVVNTGNIEPDRDACLELVQFVE